ncbi:MAG: double zinc ribbon domain-containing protein, partial [Terriglobales bacterium]
MYCPDCGHNNPEGNRFCGMCGETLPERGNRQKTSAEKEHRERVAQHDPEPVSANFRHREPIDEPVRTHRGTGVSPVNQSSIRGVTAEKPVPPPRLEALEYQAE